MGRWSRAGTAIVLRLRRALQTDQAARRRAFGLVTIVQSPITLYRREEIHRQLNYAIADLERLQIRRQAGPVVCERPQYVKQSQEDTYFQQGLELAEGNRANGSLWWRIAK
jgi:hypothetical protein